MASEGFDIKRGLKDVYFDTTEASFIDGEVGKLLYRGYNIHDLAEKATFEEVMDVVPAVQQLATSPSMTSRRRPLSKRSSTSSSTAPCLTGSNWVNSTAVSGPTAQCPTR